MKKEYGLKKGVMWKPQKMKGVTPKVKSNAMMPKSDKLVKTAIGSAIALGALGVGVSAYKAAMEAN